MALVDHWPLFGLRITTPRLELRVPTDDDLAELIEVARTGVHDPGWMPFSFPWTDLESPDFERQALQFWWNARSSFSPAEWDLQLVVVEQGRIVGSQAIGANDFRLLRSAATGSCLGLDHQGRGIGREMRAAVCHLAFEHLGALEVRSGAFVDNLASRRVSELNGYEENGIETVIRRGERAHLAKLRLTVERWRDVRSELAVTVTGLEPCLPLFGLD
ncbi:MAG: GNAT family protein [Actinomycetota bacterium]